MDLKITGTPKEIADLVLGIQSQQVDELINVANEKKPPKNQFSDFGNSLMRLRLQPQKKKYEVFLLKKWIGLLKKN